MKQLCRLRLTIFAAALMCAALGGPSAWAQQAHAVDSASLTTSDVYAVRASIDKWMEILSAGDAKSAEAFVEEGALGIYQGALADYDSSAFMRSIELTLKSQGAKGTWSNEIEEVSGSGDMAVVRSKRTVTPEGGTATVMRLLETYTRYSDGTWRLSRFVGFPGA